MRAILIIKSRKKTRSSKEAAQTFFKITGPPAAFEFHCESVPVGKPLRPSDKSLKICAHYRRKTMTSNWLEQTAGRSGSLARGSGTGAPDMAFGSGRFNLSASQSSSNHAVIRVYDDAGKLIETHEHKGDFKEW